MDSTTPSSMFFKTHCKTPDRVKHFAACLQRKEEANVPFPSSVMVANICFKKLQFHGYILFLHKFTVLSGPEISQADIISLPTRERLLHSYYMLSAFGPSENPNINNDVTTFRNTFPDALTVAIT